MARAHTDREFEAELSMLRQRLLGMGGRIEEMLDRAVRAAVSHDVALAQATVDMDPAVDEDELDVDERCLRIMARRQPVGSDLRFVAFAFKAVTDLERMGDLATGIARRILESEEAQDPTPMGEIARLAESVQAMVHIALDAFVNGDADRARQVLVLDDAVDDLYHQLFREMLARMGREADHADRWVRVQNVAKHLERIGDHATNVAEQVIFLVDGKDVRHRGRFGAEVKP